MIHIGSSVCCASSRALPTNYRKIVNFKNVVPWELNGKFSWPHENHEWYHGELIRLINIIPGMFLMHDQN